MVGVNVGGRGVGVKVGVQVGGSVCGTSGAAFARNIRSVAASGFGEVWELHAAIKHRIAAQNNRLGTIPQAALGALQQMFDVFAKTVQDHGSDEQ